MILIPGLGCSGDVWRGAEARFAADWQLHIVTVAGFAGTEPIEPPLLDSVRLALAEYIASNELESPVIVGHSLGAMVALWLAGTIPTQVGPVIALDGAAFGAALVNPSATPDTMRPRAEKVRARASSVADEDKSAQARLLFTSMVTSPEDLEWILSSVVRSDAATIGQAMYELMTTDVRPQVRAIRTPVLMMVAGVYFEGEPEQDVSPWEDQLAGVADHRVVVVPDARHFVMIDQPDFVYGEIERFLIAKR